MSSPDEASMQEGFWYDSAGRVLLIRQRAADDSVLVVAQIDGHDMSHPTWFNPGDVPPMGWSLIRPLEAQPGAPDEAKRLASELARRWLQPRLNMLHRLRGRDSMTPEEIAKARAVGRTWRSATRQLCEAFGIPEPAVPADDPSADHARELLASEADALGLAEVARSAVIFGKGKAAGFYATCDRCGASPPGSVWCVARQAQINERCPKCGAVGVADDEEELQRCYVAEFCGPHAEARAREYAAWVSAPRHAAEDIADIIREHAFAGAITAEGVLDAAQQIVERLAKAPAIAVVNRETPPSPAAPDREALGRAVHAEYQRLSHVKSPLAWDDLDDWTKEHDRAVGERLFAMGVEEGERRKREYGLAAIGEAARLQERDAAWSRVTGAADPEHVRDALLSTGRVAIERAHAEGIEEGERRARAAPAEAQDLPQDFSTRREAAKNTTGKAPQQIARGMVFSDIEGCGADKVICPETGELVYLARYVAQCMRDIIARLVHRVRSEGSTPSHPTSNVGVDSAGGGVPHEVDARHPADCEWCDLSVAGTSPAAAQDGSGEIHDPRWQPGAVWEHRSVDVARFEIVRGEPDADGRIFLRGPWGDVLAKPAALSEANGWRFVGDATPGYDPGPEGA